MTKTGSISSAGLLSALLGAGALGAAPSEAPAPAQQARSEGDLPAFSAFVDRDAGAPSAHHAQPTFGALPAPSKASSKAPRRSRTALVLFVSILLAVIAAIVWRLFFR